MGQPESRAELSSTSKAPAGPVGGMQKGSWHHFLISSPLMMKEPQAEKKEDKDIVPVCVSLAFYPALQGLS